MAARYGLTFHCDGYFLTEHDDERIPRPATEPELAMWQALVGDFDPECLPATPKEVKDSFIYSPGPFTINAKDFVALRTLPEFDPSTRRDDLLHGLFGWFRKPLCQYPPDSPWFYPERTPIYVSRSIQTGFYFEGPYQPDLHWRPQGPDRQVRPEIPMEVQCLVSMGLRPFMSRWC